MEALAQQKNGGDPIPQSPDRTGELIVRIETIIETGVADPLLEDPPRPLSIPFCRRTSSGQTVMTTIPFPGRSDAEARKFAQVLHLMKSVHAALRSGRVLTKRNLYYENTELYGSQARVDQLVDELALSLGVGRHDLGMVAAAKGLVSGAMKIHSKGSGPIDASRNLEGSAIPPPTAIRQLDLGAIRWVLILEKEATFRTLAKAKYWETSTAGQGLLVTGKGYPDLVTRSFLNMIHKVRPTMPIYALVDFDPDGINILRCYKSGSAALQHEENIVLPRLRWLGIKSNDLTTPRPDALHENHFQGGEAQRGQGAEDIQRAPLFEGARSAQTLVPLTERDRKLAVRLLGEYTREAENDADAAEVRGELQLMLMMNAKAEIQAVNDEGGVAEYLEAKLKGDLAGQ